MSQQVQNKKIPSQVEKAKNGQSKKEEAICRKCGKSMTTRGCIFTKENGTQMNYECQGYKNRNCKRGPKCHFFHTACKFCGKPYYSCNNECSKVCFDSSRGTNIYVEGTCEDGCENERCHYLHPQWEKLVGTTITFNDEFDENEEYDLIDGKIIKYQRKKETGYYRYQVLCQKYESPIWIDADRILFIKNYKQRKNTSTTTF